MTLNKLILIASSAYILVIGGGFLFYRIFIAYPELSEATLEAHKSDIKAIYASHLNERHHLSFFNHDWAKWDETYDFILGNNPEYIENNIDSSSFLRSRVNIVSILNTQGNNIYTGVKTKNQFYEISHLNQVTQDIDLKAITNQDENCGLIRFKKRIGHFCSNSIQDSKESKPAEGTLIFIRLLDDELIARLQHLTKSIITINSYDDDHSSPSKKSDIESITLKDTHHQFQLINIKDEAIGTIGIHYPKEEIPRLIDMATVVTLTILLALPAIITVLVYVFFLQPMNIIFNSISTMNKTGKLEHITAHTYITEIDIFISNFNRFIHKIKQYQVKLKNESNTDGLTQLFNRRYFDYEYDRIWRSTTRNGHSLCIIMMDIDFFKKYNDLYGHQQGDDALKAVALKLKNLVRRANETLARYGGEEFVLITESLDHNELEGLLQRIIESIQSLKIEHKASKINEYLTISCGACIIESSGSWMIQQKEAALKAADDALYEAKNSGRNKYVILPFNETQNSN